MIINGKPWVIDDDLSRRWPLYTRGNVGEVFPDVATPLMWSFLGGMFESGWREAWREFGIVAPGDFDPILDSKSPATQSRFSAPDRMGCVLD